LPDCPFHGQFKKIGHFLTALAMKKRIWLFCKIWSFFQFVTEKLSFHEIFCILVFFGQFSCHSFCYGNTVALQPFIALKCVVMV